MSRYIFILLHSPLPLPPDFPTQQRHLYLWFRRHFHRKSDGSFLLLLLIIITTSTFDLLLCPDDSVLTQFRLVCLLWLALCFGFVHAHFLLSPTVSTLSKYLNYERKTATSEWIMKRTDQKSLAGGQLCAHFKYQFLAKKGSSYNKYLSC